MRPPTFTFSYTDLNGFSSSFSVSPFLSSDSELSASAYDSDSIVSDLDLSFERALPEMLKAHLSAHRAAYLSLASVSLSLKEEELTRLRAESEQPNSLTKEAA